jgi:hypothetical protein
MASLAAAREQVSNSEYRRASILSAPNLHLDDSIFDRS